MARSRTAAGRRLLLGRPRRPETRLVAPRSRNALTSRNTCRRRKPIRSPASWIVMRPASRSSRTSSRENSLSLIDTTVIGPILLQPPTTGECHPNFAQGCHLYIAVTVFPARGVALGPRCRSGIFTFRRRITAAAVGSLDCALTRLGQDERVQPRALLVAAGPGSGWPALGLGRRLSEPRSRSSSTAGVS